MATNTSIEWTRGDDGTAGATWNPLLGCSRVSPGCDRCYAISTATIRAGNPHPTVAAAFEGLTERRDGKLDWTGRVNLLPERLTQPLHWKKPKRIFVNSQADLFHDQVPDEYIARVFAVMAATPRHTYQVLTKRHGRMRSLLSSPEFKKMVGVQYVFGPDVPDSAQCPIAWPLPNVWMGISVEDQKWADVRIPALLDTPAAVRWLSMEPLLGPVDLNGGCTRPTYWLTGRPAWGPSELVNGVEMSPLLVAPRIAWVVAGGESGAGARPMHPDWARSLRDQCQSAGVPFFFKQWGEWVAPDDMPEATFMSWDCENGTSAYDRSQPWRVGKKAAGRELDGRTWDEYPSVAVQAVAA